jgi:hypothetical protein
VKKKYAGLGGDDDFYFIGYFKFATTFKAFFSDKDKYVPLQFNFILGRQAVIKRNISFEDLQPLIWKLPGGNSISPPFFEQEHIFNLLFYYGTAGRGGYC